jgi:hypothetical protein
VTQAGTPGEPVNQAPVQSVEFPPTRHVLPASHALKQAGPVRRVESTADVFMARRSRSWPEPRSCRSELARDARAEIARKQAPRTIHRNTRGAQTDRVSLHRSGLM